MADTSETLSELEQLFQENPQQGHAQLREYRDERRGEFLRDAILLLESGRNNSFSQVVWKLCQDDTGSLEKLLFTVDLLSLEEAAKLLRLSGSKDPGYQSSLVDRLRKEIDRQGGELDERNWLRLLELLAKSVDSEKLGAMLARLCEHEDKRLRSKAAVLMGTVARNLPGRLNLLKDVDPRVRANAVESLWGRRDAESLQLLKEASRDQHHRVAANGLVGLHAAGELTSTLGILQMFRETELPRKLAGIWAMGKTADPRFLSTIHASLGQLTGRPNFALLAAARKVNTRLEEVKQRGRLEAQVLHLERADKGRLRCQFRLRKPDGEYLGTEHLLSTQVVVQEGDLRVDLFTLQHRGSLGLKQLGLLLPQHTGLSDHEALAMVEAIEECLNQKPGEDHWAIARYRAGTEVEANVAFLRDAEALNLDQLRSPRTTGGLEDALPRMVAAYPSVQSSRHLVLVLDPAAAALGAPPEEWLGQLETAGVCLSVLLPAELTGPELEQWRQLAFRRRGMVHRLGGPNDLKSALARVIDAMNPHWYLTYQLGRMVEAEGLPGDTQVEFFTSEGYGEMRLPRG